MFEHIQKQNISRDQAYELVKKYNTDQSDLNHYLESEAVMKALAQHFHQDQETWALLGLVHDIDWGLTKENTKTHMTKAPDILKEVGFTEDFIEVIMSHAYGFDCADLLHKKRTRKIEHALASAETVTGLIHAYALMRHTMENMESSGLRKKFKDKKFAAGIHREIIEECSHLGLSLEEFFTIAINAIAEIKDQVDLNNNPP